MTRGEAHRAEIGQRGAGIADDEHVAGLAFGVGVPRCFAVQVLDVVAQAFLGQQPGDEGEVALAAEQSRERMRSSRRVLVLVDGSPRVRGAELQNAPTTTCELFKLLGDNKLPILRRHCFHRLMIFRMFQPGQVDMRWIVDLAQQCGQITPLV